MPRYGRRLIEVGAEPDWDAVTAAVKAALGPLPRLQPGDELSRQRLIENLAACRQGRLWQADLGLTELPPYPFACECGRSGCDLTWSATPDQYDVRSTGRVVADGHS
ncbi:MULTISPECIES: hypothetical protein [Kribbella]|uniref:hypothetical protein n=1 Tax=Kribbella TaxID=182639 RepID=UPI0018EE7DAA|nr:MULTISPECIES: hypothetical protein [Kribbella]